MSELKYKGPAMLPAMAMIAIFMLVVALMSVFAVLNGHVDVRYKYLILPAATLLAAGVFGFLRLKRWGWAIMLASTVVFMVGYVLAWRLDATHPFQPLVMSAFMLVFFLYLVRDEVRSRLR